VSQVRARGGLRVPATVMRAGARQIGRRVLDPALPWDVQRRRLERFSDFSPFPRITMIGEEVVNGVPVEVVSAVGASPGRIVVHFHGGGYCVGSPGLARSWAAHLSARAGCRVVLPDYRLAPEHPYPAAIDDARTVVTALLDEADGAPVVLSGDSAGAGLALATAATVRKRRQKAFAGCILMAPWLDLGADRREDPGLVRRDVLLSPGWLEACAEAYAGRSAWADPSVSPLRADQTGLPPLLIQSGADELLAPDAERMAASACAAGVDVTYTRWPRMWHDFALQPGLLAAADSALAQAAWFVEAVTAG
jgi:monoterpene epsilon-lactone hydrolase